MSIRSVLCITCVRSLNISDSTFPSCFPGARIDLNAEDNVVALALAKCPARPYAELIKSEIPGVDPQFYPSTLAFILWVSYSPIVLVITPLGPF